MDIKKVCVFCASSSRIDQIYIKDAKIFGKILADNQIDLIYGGGGTGLMGAVADSVMENKGTAIGVIPHFMKEREWAHTGISRLLIVENIPQRKQVMIEESDAVIALPGGIGTLEELTEVITLKQLGQYVKPVIILNTNGFYDELLFFLSRMIRERFMHQIYGDIWKVVDKPEEILPAIFTSTVWDKDRIKYATF